MVLIGPIILPLNANLLSLKGPNVTGRPVLFCLLKLQNKYKKI